MQTQGLHVSSSSSSSSSSSAPCRDCVCTCGGGVDWYCGDMVRSDEEKCVNWQNLGEGGMRDVAMNNDGIV